jgi:hypothetical protein
VDYVLPVPWASAHVTGVNSVGTSPVQIIPSNSWRRAIKFHNPGTVTVYCYPSEVGGSPSLSALGGCFVIFPGSEVTFYGGGSGAGGAVTGAWFAFAASGGGNPLTVMEMVS